jgi:hypothetical protein
LAANLQPESQKLLWRIQATSGDREFSQEGQKDRRREQKARDGGARCRRRFGAALRAEWRGEQSNLLIF